MRLPGTLGFGGVGGFAVAAGGFLPGFGAALGFLGLLHAHFVLFGHAVEEEADAGYDDGGDGDGYADWVVGLVVKG